VICTSSYDGYHTHIALSAVHIGCGNTSKTAGRSLSIVLRMIKHSELSGLFGFTVPNVNHEHRERTIVDRHLGFYTSGFQFKTTPTRPRRDVSRENAISEYFGQLSWTERRTTQGDNRRLPGAVTIALVYNENPTAIPTCFRVQLSNKNSGNVVRSYGKKPKVYNARWRPINFKYVCHICINDSNAIIKL